MRGVFTIASFNTGWRVKVDETGEVIFFVTRSLAERRGLELAATARALHGESLVRLVDRTGRLTSH